MLSLASLYKKLKENKGFTIDKELTEYNGNGYAVALQGKETQVLETDLDLDHFADLVVRYMERLEKNQKLGCWIDSGKVYFDVSEVIDDLSKAIKTGIERKQIGIFDFNTFQTIYLN